MLKEVENKIEINCSFSKRVRFLTNFACNIVFEKFRENARYREKL